MSKSKLKLPCGTTRFIDNHGRCIPAGCRMGMPDDLPDDVNEPVKLHLERLKWVDVDYISNGAYFGGGSGDFIYCAWGDSEEIQVRVFVRAVDRAKAKALVLKKLPNARFYR